MSRDQLRSAIRELWALGINGPKSDKQKAVKKIIHAVEKEQRTMLNRIDVEELGEDMESLAENLEIAEALVAGETLAGEETVGTQEATETEKSKRPYTRRGKVATGEAPPKRRGTRSKAAPNDDGGGHPLALGNGHTNGNGHGNGNQVALSPEQLSKLWAVITGGSLGIGIEADGALSCWVSPESFNKALPVLLDRL